MVIKMNDDKSLLITIPATIYRGEKNADLITFMIPMMYGDHNMADCTAVMRYTLPDGIGRSEDLNYELMPYKGYLRFSTIADTRITSIDGIVTLWLTFYNNGDAVVLKTGEVNIAINPSEDISACMPQEDLDQLDKLAAQIAVLESTKADQGEVDALKALVGEVAEGKTVVEMIADAQTAATYDDTLVKADIKANADAIANLNANSETEGSVDYKIAQAVAAIMENPDETMNSINELVTWINDHATNALELSNQVSTNKSDIAGLKEQVGEGSVADQISAAVDAALKADGVDKYALAADLTAAIKRIVALETAKHTHTNQALLETYTQTEANLADAVAKKHEHANVAELDMIEPGDKAKWDAMEQNAKDYADSLAVNYDIAGSADKALIDAKTYADGLAVNYDAAGAADTAEANAKAHTETLLTWGSF